MLLPVNSKSANNTVFSGTVPQLLQHFRWHSALPRVSSLRDAARLAELLPLAGYFCDEGEGGCYIHTLWYGPALRRALQHHQLHQQQQQQAVTVQLDDSPVLRFSTYVGLDDPGYEPPHIIATNCSDWLSRGGLDCDRAQMGAYRRMKQARTEEELRQIRQWMGDAHGEGRGYFDAASGGRGRGGRCSGADGG